jgi:hypothetical protein
MGCETKNIIKPLRPHYFIFRFDFSEKLNYILSLKRFKKNQAENYRRFFALSSIIVFLRRKSNYKLIC